MLTVSNMKKVLLELYESNFDLLLQKEKRLVELKKLNEDDNDSTMLKVNYYTIFSSLLINKFIIFFLGKKCGTNRTYKRI